jgi:DNA-binding NarL/FixJ family response regulator
LFEIGSSSPLVLGVIVNFAFVGGVMLAWIRILIVDDFQPLRREVISMLERNPRYQVIGEAADGLDAVHKSAELEPDLILLDIGLPKLNGIEAARQILRAKPASKIVFLSEHSCRELVEEALKLGAEAYIRKFDLASELMPTIEAVFQDRQFVSRSLAISPLPSAARE